MTKESTVMTMLPFIIAVVMDAKENYRTNTVQHSTAAWDNSCTNSIETFDIIHIFFLFSHDLQYKTEKMKFYSAKSHTLMYLFNKKNDTKSVNWPTLHTFLSPSV